jgi:anti-sigma regulatory factor (Ser/Thr protein kinase)
MSTALDAAPASLIVPNDWSQLTRVSNWINEWAQRHELPPLTVQSLDLCSTEVVSNIIDHAYTDNGTHPINLHLHLQENQVLLEVEDEGKPFNPLEVEAPPPVTSIETARIGGWGVPILRRFSDGLRYRRAEGKNRLTMIFGCSDPVPS